MPIAVGGGGHAALLAGGRPATGRSPSTNKENAWYHPITLATTCPWSACSRRGEEGHRRPRTTCWKACSALLARPHPGRRRAGLAKTMAIKTLAESIGGEFKRIQFTPDLVPADLVGTRIYNQKTGDFNTSVRAGLHQPAAGRRDQPRAG